MYLHDQLQVCYIDFLSLQNLLECFITLFERALNVEFGCKR